MLNHYYRVALRHLRRHKLFSSINVVGLALGMACCLLIVRFVQDELAYDRFHKQADRIYRLTREATYPDEVKQWANTAAAPGPALEAEFASVEESVRFMRSHPRRVLVGRGEQRFYEDNVLWADASVFDVFSYPLLRGDPATALVEPFTVVLTQAMARKYFGDADPIGQTLSIRGFTENDYTVTGILGDIPAQTHLPFDLLASLSGEMSLYPMLFAGEGQWTNSLCYTYVMLREGASLDALEARLADFARRHMGAYAASRGFEPGFHLEPLTDIHLRSDVGQQWEAGGSLSSLYLFAMIGAFILVIACINYMNLATARASQRAREIGMRKVAGASRLQLIRQFIGEAVFYTLLAFVLAVVFAELLVPVLNDLTGKALAVDHLQDAPFAALLLALSIGVGVLAGSYPAFVLSAFRPVDVLKGRPAGPRGGQGLRKGLVVFQFALSSMLIAGTLVIYRQLDYMRGQDLGFDREQVVVMPIRGEAMRAGYETIKEALRRHPGVMGVTAAAGVPGDLRLIDRFTVRPAGGDESQQRPMYVVGVDHDFIEVMGLDLVTGRGFSRDFPTDVAEAFVINEAAARALGWDDPVGRRLTLEEGDGKTATVVGIVKDFHLASLHQEVEPAVLHIWPQRLTSLAVRLGANDMEGVLGFLEAEWRRHVPGEPFEYFFLDEHFSRQYASEVRLGKIFGYFALLAVCIACLGLLGLVAFMVERRRKEVGVRKVLGASVASITALLVREFVLLVLVALPLAIPLAYVGMDRWLEHFAYRIELSAGIFLAAGLIALLVALAAVSGQAVRAALADPVRTLRYE